VGTRIIFLGGELDMTQTGRLRVTLDDALETSDHVLVNLSGLRTVDSTGIRELLRAQARAAQLGKLFGVVAPSPGVRRLLEAADAAGLLADRGTDGETQAPNVFSLAAPPASTDT
jgi:anti-anti-sigma factor